MCEVCDRTWDWMDRFEVICKEMWDYGSDGDAKVPLAFPALSLAGMIVRRDVVSGAIDQMDAIHCLMDAILMGPKHPRSKP